MVSPCHEKFELFSFIEIEIEIGVEVYAGVKA
jgi:hypothetical protein